MERVMKIELLFAKQTFYYGSYHFWVISYGNRELSYQKTQSKQALNIPTTTHFEIYTTTAMCLVQVSTILFYIFQSHFLLFISLSLSLSLSREHVQIIKNEAMEKKNAYLKQQIIKKQQKKKGKMAH